MHILDGIGSIRELNIDNQRVLVRADLDLDPSTHPTSPEADALLTLKLAGLLPTLQLAAEKEARVIIAGHRGAPSRRDSSLSLERVGARLSELSGWEVFLPDDCLSDAAKRVIGDLRTGQVCLLENLRFHRGEQANDEAFARALSSFCDVYVNDAFPSSHLRLASLNALPRLIPIRGSGLLLEKEVNALSRVIHAAERPLVTVFGADAHADQLDVLDLFLRQSDHVCVGGGVAWALLAASGHDLQDTALPAELMPRCRTLLDQNHGKLVLPCDVRTTTLTNAVSEHGGAGNGASGNGASGNGASGNGASGNGDAGNTADVKRLPTGHHALDIGPESAERFSKRIAAAKTIVYTGAMGAPQSTAGTRSILESIASAPGFSLITGLQAVMAAVAAGPELMGKIDHISLGGDATMAFLAGKRMPGIEALRGASNE